MEERSATLTHRSWITARTLIESVTIGVAYGVLLRFIMGFGQPRRFHGSDGVMNVMSIGFLIVGPLVMGFLVVKRAGASRRVPPWQWIILPWITTLLTCLATAVFLLEGSICILMALPVMLVCSTIGGGIAGLLNQRRFYVSRSATLCIATLPFLISFTEPCFNAPIQERTVASRILIHAPAATVWHNIERVSAISPDELQSTWAQRIGFPRPVEATLSYEGVGGVRHASFERGLTFIETVTSWAPGHRLAFTIKADTSRIPPTTLDEHVTIGGPYFDVLNGEYRLEPLPDGSVLLHLTSHQRLSTDFNDYAGLWSDAIMQNLQTSILKVIQQRCEHA